MKDVERLVNEEIDNVTQKDWESYVHHAEKLQDEDYMKEIGCDEILEPIIIHLQESDDEDSNELQTDEDIDDDDNRTITASLLQFHWSRKNIKYII